MEEENECAYAQSLIIAIQCLLLLQVEYQNGVKRLNFFTPSGQSLIVALHDLLPCFNLMIKTRLKETTSPFPHSMLLGLQIETSSN